MQGTSCTANANILCVGPTGAPATGQAIATETWVERTTYHTVTINNNFEGRNWWEKILRSLFLPLEVYRESQRRKPLIMYLSMKRSVAGAIADLACVALFRLSVRSPVVIHLHGADLQLARRSCAANMLFKLTWRAVTDVIILSPRMAEQLDGLPKRRVHVVGNFSSRISDDRSILKKAMAVRNGGLRVLYLSNLMYTKGFSYLIDAIRLLRDEGLDISLTLAGKPLDDEGMKRDEAIEIVNHRIQDGIAYHGILSGGQKWHQLNLAHVIALPTFYRSEAQPICLIEGMSFGAVPLTTHHNYNDDFLHGDIAAFVDKESASSIADVLRALYFDRPELARRIQDSAKVAKENHTAERYAAAIDEVIDTVLQNIA